MQQQTYQPPATYPPPRHPYSPTSVARSRRWPVTTLRAAVATTVIVAAVGASGCAGDTAATGPVTIAIDSDAYAGTLAIDPLSQTLYVATSAADNDDDPDTNIRTLTAIDLRTHKIIAEISLSAYAYASDIAIDASTHTIYIVSALDRGKNTGLLTIVDGATRTVTAEIPTGTYASRVAVDQITHTVYVLNETDSIEDAAGRIYTLTLSTLAPGSRTFAAQVPIAIGPAGDLVVDDTTHVAYAISGTSMNVIDLRALSRTATISLPATGETGLLDPATRMMTVVNNEGEIAQVDLAAARYITNFEGGRLRDSRGTNITYTAALDPPAHLVYVVSNSLSDPDLVKAIDTNSGVVVDSWAVHRPGGAAVDTATHTLYVFEAGNVVIYPQPKPH